MAVLELSNPELSADEDENICFKAKNIAVVLGYKKPRNAIEKHVCDEYKTTYERLQGGLIRGPLVRVVFNHTWFLYRNTVCTN
jgi:prophage antirepressor-like protein